MSIVLQDLCQAASKVLVKFLADVLDCCAAIRPRLIWHRHLSFLVIDVHINLQVRWRTRIVEGSVKLRGRGSIEVQVCTYLFAEQIYVREQDSNSCRVRVLLFHYRKRIGSTEVPPIGNYLSLPFVAVHRASGCGRLRVVAGGIVSWERRGALIS